MTLSRRRVFTSTRQRCELRKSNRNARQDLGITPVPWCFRVKAEMRPGALTAPAGW